MAEKEPENHKLTIKNVSSGPRYFHTADQGTVTVAPGASIKAAISPTELSGLIGNDFHLFDEAGDRFYGVGKGGKAITREAAEGDNPDDAAAAAEAQAAEEEAAAKGAAKGARTTKGRTK